MTGDKIVPGQGAIIKNPLNEFKVDELAEWLAELNKELSYYKAKNYFIKKIKDAINSGELTLKGSTYYPLPGICRKCWEKNLSELIISREDAQKWCNEYGYIFCSVSDPDLLIAQDSEHEMLEKQHELHNGKTNVSSMNISDNDILIGCKIILSCRLYLESLISKLPVNSFAKIRNRLRAGKLSEKALLEMLEEFTRDNKNHFLTIISANSTARKVMALARKYCSEQKKMDSEQH